MQKFHKGDLVHVAKDLGSAMSHFTNDIDAIVIGSYEDQFGGESRDEVSYTLHLKGKGKTSWYQEGQLTLIENNRLDKLSEWEKERKEESELKGSLDWIFSHGEEVLCKGVHESTVQALADSFGYDKDLWGSHGEGSTYYINAMYLTVLAEPYLRTNDKDGWLDFCKTCGWKVIMKDK